MILQVSAQLRAPQRLIVRSQVARPNGTPVDAPFKNLEEVTGSEQDPDIYRDPHSYDDSQFYQQLLKEFLESKGLGSVAVDAAVKVWKIHFRLLLEWYCVLLC